MMPAISPANMSKGALSIPKRVNLTDMSQLPSNYSQTPGGTLFATSPGGTRIIYDRSFLMKMRNSPVASTPPKNLPFIAGVTTSISPENLKESKFSPPRRPAPKPSRSSPTKASESPAQVKGVESEPPTNTDEPQFSMDM